MVTMMTDYSCIYIPTVSKSLLIVLGNSPCHSPQTGNCSKRTTLLVKGSPFLDKRPPLAELVLSVLRKTASSLTFHHAELHCQGVCRAVCDPTLLEQGTHHTSGAPTDHSLPQRASGGTPHVRAARSARSRSESVYVRIRAKILEYERGS